MLDHGPNGLVRHFLAGEFQLQSMLTNSRPSADRQNAAVFENAADIF